MKIDKNLPQFAKENSLIVVAGDRRAKFFLAGDGEIGLLEEIEIKIPKYGDNEGFFGGKKGGKVSRMGSPSAEIGKEYIHNKFVSAFLKVVASEGKKKKIASIIIFSPAYMRSLLEKSLPKAVKGQIKIHLDGNQLNAHPLELVKLIGKGLSGGREKKVATSDKVRKLLKKK